MRCLFVLVSLLVAVSATAGPLAATTPLGIFGDDDQHIIDATDRRWDAVGRLNRESGGFCTAVLIGPREALTAAHCLWDQSQRRWEQPRSIHFVLGYRRGTYLGHARGTAFRLADGITIDTSGHPKNLRDDWAVIELELDLSAGAGVQPMPLADASERDHLAGNPIARGGYSSDRPHLPAKVDPCKALAVIEQGRLLLHDCDATAGSSGSPLVIERDGRLLVVGIQSAVVRSGDEAVAVGILMQRVLPAAALVSQ